MARESNGGGHRASGGGMDAVDVVTCDLCFAAHHEIT